MVPSSMALQSMQQYSSRLVGCAGICLSKFCALHASLSRHLDICLSILHTACFSWACGHWPVHLAFHSQACPLGDSFWQGVWLPVTPNGSCIWAFQHVLHVAKLLTSAPCESAGIAGYGTQICMTYALKYAKAAPALAMSYLSVVWGLLGGYFVFHEVSLCPYLCYLSVVIVPFKGQTQTEISSSCLQSSCGQGQHAV